jgi:PAS domain S-box-containing protein
MENLSFFENRNNMEDIRLLNRTIETFKGAASRFETYYQHLEVRVKELDLELKKKNKELKKNLEEKEKVKNYLRNILESLTTGVIVVDLDGVITTFNRAAEKITGLAFEEVNGKRLDQDFFHNLFPKLRIEPETFWNVDQSVEFETEICQHGEKEICVSLSSFPVKNYWNEKIGTAITFQDITQLKRLEERANRLDRLAAMGEMAAEIAHEIRNPLGSIELFATTLKRDLEGEEELQVLAEHISSGVRSMNNIIKNLLLFVRPQEQPEFNKINISQVLNESLLFSKHIFESNSEIVVIREYSAKPLFVKGDAELLKQACLNLILNAVQAMPRGGRLVISIQPTKNKNDGNTPAVKIQIRDNGTGVSRDDMTQIFNPFFTTKRNGTGLGLAVVHNIMEIHNGTIEIESSKSKGTVCMIVLPGW